MKLFKSRKCKTLFRYTSPYSAAQDSFYTIGSRGFYKCRKCKGWHIKK